MMDEYAGRMHETEDAMDFDIGTPAVMFSAISLLMLAYTNRFLALASLIRQHNAMYRDNPDPKILKQITNFRVRLSVIKWTQIFGVISFLFCVVSMFLIFVESVAAAKWSFALSLILLFISLLLSLRELFLSIGALRVELDEIR